MNAANGPAAAVDDIRKDLQTLREDVLRLAAQVSTLVSATGDQTISDVKQRIRQMGDTVSDLSERGKGIATDMIDDVGASLEERLYIRTRSGSSPTSFSRERTCSTRSRQR